VSFLKAEDSFMSFLKAEDSFVLFLKAKDNFISFIKVEDSLLTCKLFLPSEDNLRAYLGTVSLLSGGR
jgi:hypothetical protein